MARKNKPSSIPDMSREIEAFIKQLKEEEKRQAAEDERLGAWLPPEPDPTPAPQRPRTSTSVASPSARSFNPSPPQSPQLEAAELQIQAQNRQIRWLLVALAVVVIWGVCSALPPAISSIQSQPLGAVNPAATPLWDIEDADSAWMLTHQANYSLANHNSKLALIHAYQALQYGLINKDKGIEPYAYTVLFDAVHQMRLYAKLPENVVDAHFHPNGLLFTVDDAGAVWVWNPQDLQKTLFYRPLSINRTPRLIFNSQWTHVLAYESLPRPIQDTIRLYAVGTENNEFLIPVALEEAIGEAEMAVFSPDGMRLLTTYGLWHVDGRLIKQFATSDEKIYKAVGFNRDASRFFTLTETGAVFLWNGEGVRLADLSTAGHTIASVEFNTQGTHLFTLSNRSVAQIWDENGTLVGTLEEAHPIIQFAFSPDATRLVTVDHSQTIRFWNQEGQLVQTVDRGLRRLYSIQFSPDGTQLLTVGCLAGSANHCVDSEVALWDGNGRLLHQLYGHRDQVQSAKFSPNSQYILTTEAQTARLWNHTGELIAVLPSKETIRTASFSEDGDYIITIDDNRQGWLWNVHTPTQFLEEHNGHVNLLAYSQDGSRLLTASTTGRKAYLWDAHGRLLFAKNRIEDMATIAINPQGTRFVLGNTLWDDQGRLVAPLQGLVRDVLLTAQFNPDGTHLLTTHQSGVVYLWDGQDGTLLAVLQEGTPRGALNSAVFNHDGTRILSTNNSQQNPFVHDVDGNLLTILYNGRSPEITPVALFSHDSELILTITHRGHIQLWNKDGQLVRERSSITVNTAAFNANSTHFVTVGTQPSYVHLWNTTDLQYHILLESQVLPAQVRFNHSGTHLLALNPYGQSQLFDVNNPTRYIASWQMAGKGQVALFSPQDNYILTGDDQGTMWLLDAQARPVMQMQTSGNRPLDAAAFHPHETYLVTPNDNGRARIWMPLDQLMAQAQFQLGALLTRQECQTYFGNNQPFFCPKR